MFQTGCKVHNQKPVMTQFKWEFDIAEVEFIETDNNGDYNIHLYSRNEPIVVRGSCTIMLSNGKILIQ